MKGKFAIGAIFAVLALLSMGLAPVSAGGPVCKVPPMCGPPPVCGPQPAVDHLHAHPRAVDRLHVVNRTLWPGSSLAHSDWLQA